MNRRYFKRRWDEDRGDEFSSWGHAVYLFAADASGLVEQQFEIYDDGHVLAYDLNHVGDAYGMLTDQRLDIDDFLEDELTASEFAEAIADLQPHNR